MSNVLDIRCVPVEFGVKEANSTEIGAGRGPVSILSRPLEYESLCWRMPCECYYNPGTSMFLGSAAVRDRHVAPDFDPLADLRLRALRLQCYS